MKPSKSINSLASHHHPLQQQQQQQPYNNGPTTTRRHPSGPSRPAANNSMTSAHSPTSPICRCRVMYLGSSVPHITKDGLQGIQEPLRELYPDKASLASGNAGIDSWLSVWSNGILIENVDETGREMKRFFKIDALHYCAAVKYVPQIANHPTNGSSTLPNGGLAALPKFLPLDSPNARMQQNDSNPPVFASILRRTTGVKVLECHAFICKREAAANALVRCCFHAYADTMYAKQIGADVDGISGDINNNNSNHINNQNGKLSVQPKKQADNNNNQHQLNGPPPSIAARRSKSIAALNDANEANHNSDSSFSQQDTDYASSIMRRKSMNGENCVQNGDIGQNFVGTSKEQSRAIYANNLLKQQQKLSKSMHHLNQPDQHFGAPIYSRLGEYEAGGMMTMIDSQSVSHHNLSKDTSSSQPPFYNPYASRVPSYPPQSIIDQQQYHHHQANNSGTLRSIKSVAANSIASTLLRSKKHAKAMSMAQINQDKVNSSFHQPNSNGSLMGGSFIMPPVPAMFLPNLPRHLINGSQTMKIPSRPMVPIGGPPMNFEAMTPKEMKKMLKKSAKYGLDPSRFAENGLPMMNFRPMPMPPPCHLPPPPPPSHQISNSGTLGSQSLFSLDMPDLASNQIPAFHHMAAPPHPPPPNGLLHPDLMGPPQPIKSILVKPNPEFLKSKAGKKWLKQQKEFKKLLPPHLDGLPIVFGPPPMDALEPAQGSANTSNMQPPPPTFLPVPQPHPGLPIMDSSGYFNPHPFYGPSGRASAASTLLRYSPHSQMINDNADNYLHKQSQALYGNPMIGQQLQHRDYLSGTENESGPYESYHQQQKRNHMVEQSVISLGDENDVEDGEEGGDDDEDGHLNGYYNKVAPPSERVRSKNSSTKRDRHFTDSYNNNHRDYEHVMQPNDSPNNYSSGIYKRGHINERAFSYSIDQEHKSDGCTSSENDCVGPAHRNSSEANQSPMRYSTTDHMFQDRYNDQSNLPVNDLAARLESQLDMKSFSNSRVKS